MNKKRIALVTGVSSGIGEATAKLLQSQGIDVVGIDKNPCNINIRMFLQCDLTDIHQIEQAFSKMNKEINQLDILINVAGVFQVERRYAIESMDLQEWNAMITTNLNSVMLVTQKAIPFLKLNKEAAIVNIASDQAFFPRSKNAAYSTTKAAIVNFTRSCAVELCKYGIRVNAIAPASVRTSFIDSLFDTKEKLDKVFKEQDDAMPLGLISPEDVAETVIFLANQQYGKITGQTIIIDGGLYL